MAVNAGPPARYSNWVTILAEPRVIISISSFFPIVGGAERQAQNLARILKARGIDVRIVTRAHPDAPAREIIDGVEVTRLPGAGPKPLKLACLLLASVFYFWRRRGTYDVVHIFQLDSHAFFAALLKPLMGGARLMVKMANLGPWGEMHRLRGLTGNWRKALFRRRIDLFTGTCTDVVGELAADGFAPEKVKIIPTGVDTEAFRPPTAEEKLAHRRELDLPADAPVAIFTGRLTAQKGVDTLLRAWQLVERRCPSAQLLVLGEGAEGERLRVMPAELGLKRVRFCGLQRAVRSYLQAADLFVFPSRADGLSNSFLEAMACGLPAVATSYGGARDIIRPGVNGCLVDIDAVGEMAEGIINCLTRPDRAAMAAAARSTAVDYASLTVVADKYLAEYRRLAAMPAG